MICKIASALLLTACGVTVELSPREKVKLAAKPMGVSLDDPDELRMRNMPNGDLLVCDDRDCTIVSEQRPPHDVRLAVADHIEDVVVPHGTMGRALVGSASGLFLCPLNEPSPCEAQTDLLPQNTLVLGLTEQGDEVSFVTNNGIGTWSMFERKVTRYEWPLVLDAPVAGITRAGDLLRLSRSPHLCHLVGLRCEGIAVPSPVAQAVILAPERWLVATHGDGILIVGDGEKGPTAITEGLPSTNVTDVLLWRGGMWLATERGLAMFDGNVVRQLDGANLAGLESARIFGLAVTSDGSLAVYADQLYFVR